MGILRNERMFPNLSAVSNLKEIMHDYVLILTSSCVVQWLTSQKCSMNRPNMLIHTFQIIYSVLEEAEQPRIYETIQSISIYTISAYYLFINVRFHFMEIYFFLTK